MKTIVNKLRFALVLGFLVMSVTAWAQRANIEKMSISTQMFLDQIEKKAEFYQELSPTKSGTSIHKVAEGVKMLSPIATPDTINGKFYISAFMRINNDFVINQLKDLGVIIECQFKNGLMTTLIPIDKIYDLAAIPDVREIEVAEVLRPMTDKVRQTTNVDDLLTLSNDARAAGLTTNMMVLASSSVSLIRVSILNIKPFRTRTVTHV